MALSIATWDGVIGGPESEPLTIHADSQLNLAALQSTFGGYCSLLPKAVDVPAGSGWIFLNLHLWPSADRTDSGSVTILDQIAAGTHDPKLRLLGTRLKAAFIATGHPISRLVVCPCAEANRFGPFQVFSTTATKWQVAVTRAIQKIREGASEPTLRFMAVVARRTNIGALSTWVPTNVDAIGMMFQPAIGLNTQAKLDQFMDGSLDGGYGFTTDLQNYSASKNIPMALSKWGPWPQWGATTAEQLACPIADLVVNDVYNKLVNKYRDRFLCDLMNVPALLNSTGYQGPDAAGKAAWVRASAAYKTLWSGAKIIPPPPLPVNTTLPSISGSSVVGSVLTCNKGAWSGTIDRYDYHWTRDGVEITPTNYPSATYTTVPADVGKGINCWVAAVNTSGWTTAGTNSIVVVDGTVIPPDEFILPQQMDAYKAYWNGATEYWCSATSTGALSTNRNAPGGLVQAVATAPTRSIINLIGNATNRFPAVNNSTGGGKRLWIRAEIPCFQDLDTSVSPAVVVGLAAAGDTVRSAGFYLQGFGGCLIEGVYCDEQAGGNITFYLNTGECWAYRCRTYNVASQGFQFTATPICVMHKCWQKCDKLAVNAGGPSDKSGWRTDYAAWGWGPGKFYYAGNFIEGNTNNGISQKQESDGAYYSGNAWHLWAQDTYPTGSPAGTGTSSGTSGIFLGQTGDYATGSELERTIGEVIVRNEVFNARKALFVQFQNVQDVTVENCKVISSNGMTIDTADHAACLKGPRHPRKFIFRNNIIEPAGFKFYRGYTFSKDFVCTLENNTTPTPLTIEDMAANVVIPNDSNTPTGVWVGTRPVVTRVNGNVSGFKTYTGEVVAPIAKPVSTAAPAMTGSDVVGNRLDCTTGTWSNVPTGYTYAWFRGTTAISGATANNYTTITADVGKAVSCKVTASNAGGDTAVSSNSKTITAAPTAGDSPFVVVYPSPLDNMTGKTLKKPGIGGVPAFNVNTGNNFNIGANQVWDLRGLTATVHENASSASSFNFNNGPGTSAIVGGKSTSSNSDYFGTIEGKSWKVIHGDTSTGSGASGNYASMYFNGPCQPGFIAHGFYCKRNMDGIVPKDNSQGCIAQNCVLTEIRDDVIQDDSQNDFTFRGCFLQGHVIFSWRPGADSPAGKSGRIMTVENCIIHLDRQMYLGEDTNGDPGSKRQDKYFSPSNRNNGIISGATAGMASKWLQKTSATTDAGGLKIRYKMKNVLIRIDTPSVDGINEGEAFPGLADGVGPGSNFGSSYENVHVVWLGPSYGSTGGPVPWNSIMPQTKEHLAGMGITVHDGGAGGTSEQDAFDYYQYHKNVFDTKHGYNAGSDTYAFNRP